MSKIKILNLLKDEREDFVFGKLIKDAVKQGGAEASSIKKVFAKWKRDGMALLLLTMSSLSSCIVEEPRSSYEFIPKQVVTTEQEEGTQTTSRFYFGSPVFATTALLVDAYLGIYSDNKAQKRESALAYD